jgi:hypothetical protein
MDHTKADVIIPVLRNMKKNELIMLGICLGFCLGLVLPARADDQDSSWYTSYGHVRNIYYSPRNYRTYVIFETDDHKVLTLDLETSDTNGSFPPPAIWTGEYVKLDYGHRWTVYADQPFLEFRALQLPEVSPLLTVAPRPISRYYHRRKHVNHLLPLTHRMIRDPLPNHPYLVPDVQPKLPPQNEPTNTGIPNGQN